MFYYGTKQRKMKLILEMCFFPYFVADRGFPSSYSHTSQAHNHLCFHFRPLSPFIWFSKKKLLTAKLKYCDLRKEHLWTWTCTAVYEGCRWSQVPFFWSIPTLVSSEGAASCAGSCLWGFSWIKTMKSVKILAWGGMASSHFLKLPEVAVGRFWKFCSEDILNMP